MATGSKRAWTIARSTAGQRVGRARRSARVGCRWKTTRAERRALPEKRAQNRQVLHVLVHVLGLRGFEATGMVLESRVVHDVAKCFAANLSLADVFVPVHARVQVSLGIIEVKREHL